MTTSTKSYYKRKLIINMVLESERLQRQMIKRSSLAVMNGQTPL